MRWMLSYLALWTLCGAVVLRDFAPLVPHITLFAPPLRAYAVVLGYVATLAILGVILPGKIHDGVPLSDGSVLKYKCNGLLIVGTVVTALSIAYWNRYIHASWVAENIAALFIATNILAVLLSLYLFVKGRLYRPKNWLKPRSVYHDFVMGAELNPFVCGLNLKFFSYRPAMSGWLLVNLSFLCLQYETYGFITSRMLFYQLAAAWYIFDYFVHEPKMLSTWDIIAEHFGLMLVWGDYVFIVYAFSIQNHFLLHYLEPMSTVEAVLIFLVFLVGFTIFRGANSQKHQFKTRPRALIWGKPPIVVGGRLLASGFWGIARHMNYTGDLLLALSLCLPCGIKSSLAYFYFIYLLLLTVHREKRDDERCSKKYKSVWDDYCLHVPYRMVPFLY